jgi:hypothetical protein
MLCSVHENRFSRTRHQMLTWGGGMGGTDEDRVRVGDGVGDGHHGSEPATAQRPC